MSQKLNILYANSIFLKDVMQRRHANWTFPGKLQTFLHILSLLQTFAIHATRIAELHLNIHETERYMLPAEKIRLTTNAYWWNNWAILMNHNTSRDF